MPVAPAPTHQLMISNSNATKPGPDVKEPSPSTSTSANNTAFPPAPQVHVNGKPALATGSPKRPKSSASSVTPEADGSGWGANFWVTLIDPEVCTCFDICCACGVAVLVKTISNVVRDSDERVMVLEIGVILVVFC